MRKTFCLIFLLVLLLSQYSFGQEAIAQLKGASLKCQSVRNGYLEADMYIKYPAQKDTFHLAVKGYFKKIKADSIFPIAFHFDFDFQNHPDRSLLFTGRDFAEYFSYDSVATLLSGDLWADRIRSYYTDKKIYTPITAKDAFPLPQPSDYTDSRHQFLLIGKEDVNGQTCFHVHVKETPLKKVGSDLQILSQQYEFWIGKDSIPIQYIDRSTDFGKIDTSYFYRKVILRNYQLNQLKSDSSFEFVSIPSYYKLKTYSETKEAGLLNKNETAPQWKLTALDGKTITLSDFKGKLIVLDFFYKACSPCMKAIPILNSLNERYKDKGLVILGIDPYDNGELTELKSFVAKRKMQYPFLLEDYDSSGSVSKLYSVSLFPTLYVIDKQGKVIHAQSGYSDAMESILADIIKHNL